MSLMSESKWKMKCKICGLLEEESLITIQEHAMNEHGYSRRDLMGQKAKEIWPGFWRWWMPDGVLWLEAEADSTEP